MAKAVTHIHPLRGSDKDLVEKILPKIELIDPEQIKLDPNNPRRLTEKGFKDLVKSVEDFWQMLFYRPIVIDDDGIAIGGNKRVLACRKAGFLRVPIIRAAQLNLRQRREFMLKDNLHAGDWDLDSIANNWDPKDLNDWGFKIPDMEQKPSTKEVKFTAKEKEPCFDVVLKADTELARQQIIGRLSSVGFVDGVDFFTE